MRLTLPEQSVVKCILNAKEPVTYHYLVGQTHLDFLSIDKAIKKLTLAGRVEIGLTGGFALTKLAKKHPVIRLLLQETVEERLLVTGTSSRYNKRRKQVRKFMRSNRRAVYGWARKIKRLAVKMGKKG